MAQGSTKTVAVIGTGRMGGAFGAAFSRAGYTVIYGSRTPSDTKVQGVVGATKGAKAMTPKDAAAAADIIVLAVPWAGTEATVKSLGDCAGKLVLDPTNAIQFGKDGASLSVATSGGELVRDWMPGAKVVKAFNTVGYFVIADTAVLDGKVGCFLAGDDAASKAQVRELVTAMGFDAIDVGGMRAARVLEGMSTLYMVPYMSGNQGDRFEWAVRRSGNVKLGPVRTAG
ncbi:MAG: NAD(P)-binding domain-containing protein [Rhodospirillaceae bacterium]|nr:NAD(P)-binding domain-containing protein [Rhodospirillaceae bacterium]